MYDMTRKPRRLMRNSGYEIRDTKFGIRHSKFINQLANQKQSYIDIVSNFAGPHFLEG